MVNNNKYALISVFDKTDIVDFAQKLSSLGYKIISTGGTSRILEQNGVKVIPIRQITKTPESFDGRVKTISTQVEGGILYDRSNPKHVEQAKSLGIFPIDIVVCNLYPFEKTIFDPNVTFETAIENIDVGGSTMVRAAAKNFKHVLVVINPNDYANVLDAIKNNSITTQLRQSLAAKAFAHISLYDAQIASYLERNEFPHELTIPGRKVMDLRYGENPHQKAALYAIPNNNSPLMRLEKLWGRELSLINVTDINAGSSSVRMFTKPCAVIIKHNNPCGIALGNTADEALKRAIEADPESAFGGIIVVNKPITLKTAQKIAAFKDERKGNIDIVAAPAIEDEALKLLTSVRKSMGIYIFGHIPKNTTTIMDLKWIDGGFIWQQADIDLEKGFTAWRVVTKKQPIEKQLQQMQIAWKFIASIRSNAVIIVDKDIPMTRGIGTGQTSRVRSTKIALEQASEYTQGAILASDSFFPFPDSVNMADEKGIAAIIQQGGSINDQASIDAANEAGITMVFTGRRAFWH